MCCDGKKGTSVIPIPEHFTDPSAVIVPAWTEAMRFPTQVKVPYGIAGKAGVPRHLLIKTTEQPLPVLLVAWLQSDNRYSKWLEAKQPTPEEPKQPAMPKATPKAESSEAPKTDESAVDSPAATTTETESVPVADKNVDAPVKLESSDHAATVKRSARTGKK